MLASLYSSEGSVMERHHLAQAMCILNTDDCNFLENLSREEYTKFLDLMREIILGEARVLTFTLLLVHKGSQRKNKQENYSHLGGSLCACDYVEGWAGKGMEREFMLTLRHLY